MVKTLRCSSCGAALNITSGQPNVVCEYCKSFVRVADEKQSQFDAENIIKQIAQIWPRVRNDNFTNEYQRIKDLISSHRYLEASRNLDYILEKDSTQARAWFYKALLPILVDSTILFKGHYVNIIKVSQITDRSKLNLYLKSCGLSMIGRKEFLDFYRSKDFLFEQQIKFYDKAIEHASTKERADFFKETKAKRIKLQKKTLRRRRLTTFGLIFVLFAVIIGSCVVLWNFLQGSWHV